MIKINTKALRACQKACANEKEVRTYLQSILLDFDRKTAIGTNGHIMVEADINTDQTGKVLIKLSSLIPNKDGNAHIDLDNERVLIEGHKKEVPFEVSDAASYPDWTRPSVFQPGAFSPGSHREVGLNPLLIANVLGDVGVRVSFQESADDALKIEPETDDVPVRITLMPIRLD